MPIKIVRKSQTTGKSIELTQDKDGKMGVKSFNVQQSKSHRELFKLDFVFNTNILSEKKDAIIETLEYLCWVNSNTKKQAEDIGWTTDISKLEIFLGQALFLPHSIYYSCNQDFMRKHCPHISAMADVSADQQYSERKYSRK